MMRRGNTEFVRRQAWWYNQKKKKKEISIHSDRIHKSSLKQQHNNNNNNNDTFISPLLVDRAKWRRCRVQLDACDPTYEARRERK